MTTSDLICCSHSTLMTSCQLFKVYGFPSLFFFKGCTQNQVKSLARQLDWQDMQSFGIWSSCFRRWGRQHSPCRWSMYHNGLAWRSRRLSQDKVREQSREPQGHHIFNILIALQVVWTFYDLGLWIQQWEGESLTYEARTTWGFNRHDSTKTIRGMTKMHPNCCVN